MKPSMRSLRVVGPFVLSHPATGASICDEDVRFLKHEGDRNYSGGQESEFRIQKSEMLATTTGFEDLVVWEKAQQFVLED